MLIIEKKCNSSWWFNCITKIKLRCCDLKICRKCHWGDFFFSFFFFLNFYPISTIKHPVWEYRCHLTSIGKWYSNLIGFLSWYVASLCWTGSLMFPLIGNSWRENWDGYLWQKICENRHSGLAPDCGKSTANTLELPLSCTKPLVRSGSCSHEESSEVVSGINTVMSMVNTLRPRQDGRHFPDDIFKWIFLHEIVWISIKISLEVSS